MSNMGRGLTSRREVLAGAAIGGMMMAAGPVLGSTGALVVETAQGKVSGQRLDNCIAFRGIRYAVAQRFQRPVAPPSWTGVKDATAPGASAPQTNATPPPGPPYAILAQLPRPKDAKPPVALPESEDCLFLNIWTPALRDGRKRPVMVWLHGGFFYAGNGSGLDGSGIAGQGEALVVSLNHRLNAFGYTHLADLAGGEFPYAGNAGMMDIVAALEWIRDNIESFGGDPARVMVFGSSGGGMKTTFLMASDPAKGLFSRAGVQSGPGLRFMERDDASAVTERLLRALNLPVANLRDLATMPGDRLLAAYHSVAAAMKPARFTDLPCFAPVIDQVWLPDHPFSPNARKLTSDVPMLIGCNAQEMSFFWGNDPDAFTLDDAGMTRRVEAFAGDRAKDVIVRYRTAYPDSTAARLYLQIFSDYSLALPTMAQADRHAAAGGRTYAYRLDLQSPALGGKLGALHTIESSLIFNTVAASRAIVGQGEKPEQLSRIMSAAWTSFAATGDPGAAGSVAWPRYDAQKRATIVFDDGATPVDDPNRLVRETMADLLKA